MRRPLHELQQVAGAYPSEGAVNEARADEDEGEAGEQLVAHQDAEAPPRQQRAPQPAPPEGPALLGREGLPQARDDEARLDHTEDHRGREGRRQRQGPPHDQPCQAAQLRQPRQDPEGGRAVLPLRDTVDDVGEPHHRGGEVGQEHEREVEVERDVVVEEGARGRARQEGQHRADHDHRVPAPGVADGPEEGPEKQVQDRRDQAEDGLHPDVVVHGLLAVLRLGGELAVDVRVAEARVPLREVVEADVLAAGADDAGGDGAQDREGQQGAKLPQEPPHAPRRRDSPARRRRRGGRVSRVRGHGRGQALVPTLLPVAFLT
mmetsp:Transcript_8928/g.25218  ORF Transcript_8928/g.25218 Transcript_8928/m.25218 type:complete len:319 (-) Transcript_8928:8-964(-)